MYPLCDFCLLLVFTGLDMAFHKSSVDLMSRIVLGVLSDTTHINSN